MTSSSLLLRIKKNQYEGKYYSHCLPTIRTIFMKLRYDTKYNNHFFALNSSYLIFLSQFGIRVTFLS